MKSIFTIFPKRYKNLTRILPKLDANVIIYVGFIRAYIFQLHKTLLSLASILNAC